MSEHVEEILADCSPTDREAAAKLRDYICRYLRAIKRGDEIIAPLVTDSLLAEMCLPGEPGRAFLEGINRKLQGLKSSEILPD